MTAPAAFKATFSDFRLVKGRKVAQIVVEVPIEEADNALLALGGIPRPDLARWVAVARLSPVASISEPAAIAGAGVSDGAPASEKSERATGETKKEYTLANRVGMTCNDPNFREWLYRAHGVGGDQGVADFVRGACGVESRKDILPGTVAATKWHALTLDYEQATGRMAEERR